MDQNVVVVKVGSNTLIDENGVLRRAVIRDVLISLKRGLEAGFRVILVSSGAVKLGRWRFPGVSLPISVAAAVGQIELFGAYREEAREIGIIPGELLLTRPHLVEREQFRNLQRTIEELFIKKIVPIVNENDAAVAGTDWSFGDNDTLASALAIVLNAERLVILTHIDGLFDSDPAKAKNARLIEEVEDINKEILNYSSSGTSKGGRGGMISKLKAARICTAFGVHVYIVNGLEAGNTLKAIQGERVGTFLKAKRSLRPIRNRERWLLAAKNSSGSVEVDDGAVEALRKGKSLLAVGVRKIYGEFDAKEIIEIVDAGREGVAFGIVDYAKNEIEQILRVGEIQGKQLMHADNIIVLSLIS